MAKEKESFDKLLAQMAHDIKAPLASIISLLDVILKGYLKEQTVADDLGASKNVAQ